ncbi:protein-glucosylgalactosylhydroxylysine glucosidase isoform X5 [Pteropus medius]|uniref:protein-glucosylgalactosylhydroxylysine glucosidase isoform X5 n=1 Tax=Pteropus vampyrus TaxID=132908 RepID=UPI00196B512D|nr:protein-glucosylgalactosylhydroxylysine glucosidase isoform X5 [Pteropus giganteus]
MGALTPPLSRPPLGASFSMADATEDPTIFTAHSLPSDSRLWATVTNAYLGTRVYHNALHVSGIYNGAGGDTHRAILPSPLNIQLEAPARTGEQLTKTFSLDTNTGSFLHTVEDSSFRAAQRIYAHRTLPHVLVCSVSITRLGAGSRPITVLLRSAFSPESPDLALHLGPDFRGARYLHGHTLTPEQPGGPQQEVHMLWTPVPPALTLAAGEDVQTWEFLVVVGGSQAEVRTCLGEALQLQAERALYPAHAQAWAQLWAGCGLDVPGPLRLRQALRAALYYLLSALPQPGAPGHTCHGLSPGGLSNGSRDECYWGHVFWDQDLWMFPNVLVWHPEAARGLLEYRIRTLAGALDNARRLGYQGAKFAWESAGSGLEVCPEDVYGVQEIHINGAVLLAFQLYYSSTQESCPPTSSIQGSTTPCTPTSCSRTACALLLLWPGTWASLSLAGGWRWPIRSRCPLTRSTASTLSLMGTSLRLSPRRGGEAGRRCAPGVPCPLLREPSHSQKKPGGLRGCDVPPRPCHDLGEDAGVWGGVLTAAQPCPTGAVSLPHAADLMAVCPPPQSMFAVGWMELQEPSRAWDLLERSFANITEPFKVWTENSDGSGAVNFLTGMGGFLQAALFGFTGFRITGAGVTFDPMCPAGVTGVSVSGISYQGNKLDFSFSAGLVTVKVRARAGPWAPPLEVELWPSQARLPLPLGHEISFPCSAGRIQRSFP